jgi:hypothetical protein
MSVSKETRKAWSFSRRTRLRKAVPVSCSSGRTVCCERGIEEDAEGERLIDLGDEVLEGLRHLVFKDLAVVTSEVRDEQVLLVADIEIERDKVDVLTEGGDGVGGVVGVGIAGHALRGGIGRRRGLGVQARGGHGEQRREEQEGKGTGHHGLENRLLLRRYRAPGS